MTKISDAGSIRTAPRLRYSEHINRRTTQSIFRAFDFAEAKGCPLDTYVVIVLADGNADEDFRAIRHKFRDWLTYLSRRDGATARPHYVFTFENPDGHTHVNWVLHVPDRYKKEFAAKLAKWVVKVRGRIEAPDIDVQAVTAHPKSLAKYIAKGTDPAFVKHFFLERVHAPQGWFRGIRAAASTSLDKAARTASAFRPQRGARPWRTPLNGQQPLTIYSYLRPS